MRLLSFVDAFGSDRLIFHSQSDNITCSSLTINSKATPSQDIKTSIWGPLYPNSKASRSFESIRQMIRLFHNHSVIIFLSIGGFPDTFEMIFRAFD